MNNGNSIDATISLLVIKENDAISPVHFYSKLHTSL